MPHAQSQKNGRHTDAFVVVTLLLATRFHVSQLLRCQAINRRNLGFSRTELQPGVGLNFTVE